jgi:hypothetical protein
MVPFSLVDPSVHENLHAAKQIAAVVVVPSGRDHGNIRSSMNLCAHTMPESCMETNQQSK